MRGGGGRALATALALLAVVLAALVGAGPAAAETTLQIDAGYAGSFVPGQPVPVRVSVAADRLVRATLEVVVGSGAGDVPVAMAVEVPGGSQKQFVLVAPTSFEQTPSVGAQLRQDGRVVASGESQLRTTTDQELVGLLPGVLRGRGVPGPAALSIDVGTARFAAIGEAELERAPSSLGPLSTLAMDTDELARLAPQARAGVLSWIQDGGRLLVDAERGRAVPGLPDAWQPGGRGRAAAGSGEVVATEGAMAAGRWANLVEPSDRATETAKGGADMSVASSLASAAGLRSPRLGWLVGFLVVYVVAVGPVLFFAVRRRQRPELAWVAVPLVAILFSGGAYAVGRNLRKATQLVHGTVLTNGPAGPMASSYLGVFSRGGETARIGFPAGWSTLPLQGGSPFGAGVSGVTVTADGFDARLPLDAGQFALLAATGPVPAAGGLEVSASTDANGRVTGTIRNPTAFTLDEVAVFAGADGATVGTLAPGEERDWTVANPHPFNGGRGAAEFRLWGMDRGFGDSTATVDMGLWQATMRTGGSGSRPSGEVVAAGWTRDFVPGVRVGGREVRPEGRTVLVATAPVRLGAPTDPLDFAVRQDVVRDPFSERFNGPARGSGSVVRFVLPAGAPSTGLALRNPFGSAEFWQDGGWRQVSCDGCRGGQGPVVQCAPGIPCPAPGPPGAMRFGGGISLAVPDGAIRDGVLWARVPGPASLDSGVAMTLGRAEAP